MFHIFHLVSGADPLTKQDLMNTFLLKNYSLCLGFFCTTTQLYLYHVSRNLSVESWR